MKNFQFVEIVWRGRSRLDHGGDFFPPKNLTFSAMLTRHAQIGRPSCEPPFKRDQKVKNWASRLSRNNCFVANQAPYSYLRLLSSARPGW